MTRKISPKISPFRQFCERWKNGCGSSLCGGTDGLGDGVRIVLARGQIPCDVLMIGEAPGESENVLGMPFVGPAGQLLDRIVTRALEQWQVPGTEGENYNSVRVGFGNLVGCIPRDPEKGGKAGEPLLEDIRDCSDRLRQFVALCRPRVIVCVGTLARDWMDPKFRYNVWLPERKGLRRMVESEPLHPGATIPRVSIDHPAYILRSKIVNQGLMIQRASVTIRDAVETFVFPTETAI